MSCVPKTMGEVHLYDNKISIFGVRRADVTGLRAGTPHVEGLALPKSFESGNLTLAKAVIRRTSAKALNGAPEYILLQSASCW